MIQKKDNQKKEMIHNIILYKRKKLRKAKIQLAFCFCLLFAVQSLKGQQELMFSQYMFNMSYINPAYAGNRAVNNISAFYRTQWLNVPGAPNTMSLSWDQRHEGSNVGYGIQLYNDAIGVESTTGLQTYYSYRIPFNNSSLSFGLSAGVIYYQADNSRVETTVEGDHQFSENASKILPSAGVGILYANGSWYAGLSIPALLTTKVNVVEKKLDIIKASNHYFLTTGYIFDVTDGIKLKPSILLKAVKGAPMQYDFNLNAWFHDAIGVGMSYRTGDAFIGMFELQIAPKVRLGYAYDLTISNLKTYSKGTHELMVRYEFVKDKKKRSFSPRYY